MLRIHSHLEDLRKVDRLESWVFQITRNAVTDHFREKRHAARYDVKSLVDDSDDIDGDNVNAEVVACLGPFIERLPEDQRRALTMYELDGMPQKDIAIRESISLSGAKSRIQRGRKSLEAMLEACCEFHIDGRGNVLDYEATDISCCKEDCR